MVANNHKLADTFSRLDLEKIYGHDENRELVESLIEALSETTVFAINLLRHADQPF